jgi:hypothetical protein
MIYDVDGRSEAEEKGIRVHLKSAPHIFEKVFASLFLVVAIREIQFVAKSGELK